MFGIITDRLHNPDVQALIHPSSYWLKQTRVRVADVRLWRYGVRATLSWTKLPYFNNRARANAPLGQSQIAMLLIIVSSQTRFRHLMAQVAVAARQCMTHRFEGAHQLYIPAVWHSISHNCIDSHEPFSTYSASIAKAASDRKHLRLRNRCKAAQMLVCLA